MHFAKLFWDFPRSATEPPGTLPAIGFDAIFRSFTSGILLLLCWMSTNVSFTIWLGQEPLNQGKPLTAPAKDPVGSLLNGLKTNREVAKSFAFWELSLISQRFPDQRKAIFNDIDREGGAAWSQVLNVSVELIEALTARINEIKVEQKPKPQENQKEPEIDILPRLVESPKKGDIFAASPKSTSRRGKFADTVSNTAKSYGQSPDWTPVARAKARDAFGRASAVVLTPETKRRLIESSRELKLLTGPASKTDSENIHPFIAQVLRTPVGIPFRQPFAQRLSGIIFGHPHSTLCPLVDAIESVTGLLVASISEDRFGKVCADVSKVVRLYTETIMTVESFAKRELNVHWTDINFPPSSQPQAQAAARRVPDVDLLLDVLKASLGKLVTTFGKYARDFKIDDDEMRRAKTAAGVEDKGNE